MSENPQTAARPAATATRLAHAGRTEPGSPFVNPPVVHASTVLFESAAQIAGRAEKKAKWTYGRRGTPTSAALETAISELEGAEGTVLTPSGASACDVALLSVLAAGDHLLMIDTVYGPTRNFCNGLLARFGVETTFFDPLIGAGIEALIRPNTRAIFLESPGSLTFEMPDVPAIAAVARAHDVVTLIDNTWATPLYFRPLDHGVDVSIMAATKYVVGHSDALIGTVAAGPRAWDRVRTTHGDLGMFTGPDDMYLALRGLRTMGVRLAHQQRSAIAIAEWLAGRPEVTRVLHPALPGDPGHAIWKRDFTGASGLFSFVLRPAPREAADAFLDALRLFGLGFSWGGFESLATAPDPRHVRTAVPWTDPGQLIRLHIGLEDVDDLRADLAAGLAAFAAHAG
jgi:cystathionine beta-lyase